MKKLFSSQNLTDILYFVGSIIILLAMWAGVSVVTNYEIPTPWATWAIFKEMIADPFYDYGPNDKGIGVQLLSSIKRVFTGFGWVAWWLFQQVC